MYDPRITRPSLNTKEVKGNKMKEIKEFTMTDEQFEKLLDACKPVPMIMLQCGTPKSPQENANAAWEALGDEMGFKYRTVRPASSNPKHFIAEVMEESK